MQLNCLNVSSAGIPPHVDTHSAFEDGIAALSLGAQVTHCFFLFVCLFVSVCLPFLFFLFFFLSSNFLIC